MSVSTKRLVYRLYERLHLEHKKVLKEGKKGRKEFQFLLFCLLWKILRKK